MPSAPRRQAAARAARNIHHQYSTPFVPLPYHACDHRSTAGRYEEDPEFNAGGYLYRSYANQMPDAFEQHPPDSGEVGAGGSVRGISARGGRKAGSKETKLRTSSFPYDQYLVDLYETSPKRTGEPLSSHADTNAKAGIDESQDSISPQDPDDCLLRSPSPLVNPGEIIFVPETPPFSPSRSLHKVIDGSSSLSEPSASSSNTSVCAPIPPARVYTPLIRPSQLNVHTPPGSPLQWWADLSQLPIPEEARGDEVEDELADISQEPEAEVDHLQLEVDHWQSLNHIDIDAEGETEAAHDVTRDGSGSPVFDRQRDFNPAPTNSASQRPLPVSPQLPARKGSPPQLPTDISFRLMPDNANDRPFRPRSAAFRRIGQNIAHFTPMVPEISAIEPDMRRTDPQLVELRHAWLDLTRAHDGMKEVMGMIGLLAPRDR